MLGLCPEETEYCELKVVYNCYLLSCLDCVICCGIPDKNNRNDQSMIVVSPQNWLTKVNDYI